MRERLISIVRTNFLVLGLGAIAMTAIGASATQLMATTADCADYICKGEDDCRAAKCDVCHKDERCAKLPEIE